MRSICLAMSVNGRSAICSLFRLRCPENNPITKSDMTLARTLRTPKTSSIRHRIHRSKLFIFARPGGRFPARSRNASVCSLYLRNLRNLFTSFSFERAMLILVSFFLSFLFFACFVGFCWVFHVLSSFLPPKVFVNLRIVFVSPHRTTERVLEFFICCLCTTDVNFFFTSTFQVLVFYGF